MTATHPTDRELEAFLLGKLVAPDDLAIESHLAECDECRERAVQTPADDTLTELLAAARTLVEVQRSAAPTPTFDGSTTPPAFAPTLAWDGSAAAGDESKAPPALAGHPKYRVVRRLGSGGMGTVWLAEHLVMNRPVAVKVIRPDLLARPGATNRFLREVRAAAKLHHPNIVTAFDAEPVGDSCLLVMEYVPGQTLGERLEAGPLPVAEACRAVRDAARGLAHAHAAGLVHRDVKPHNLIRAADGTTKVLDFGLAAVGAGEVIPASGDGLTGAGMVVGTPDYIAPEQIADPHAADARADIYGLGCTFYHLLAGHPPLPDGSVSEKLAAQPTHEPDPIPGLASDLAAVLAKMLAKRAEDRYQTADEVVESLNRIMDNVRPTPPAKELRQENRWSLAAVLLAGAIVVATGVVFKIQRDNQVITVATDDDDIEVMMKRKGEVLRVIDKKSGQTWEIDTEKNQITLADGAGGLSLDLPDGKSVVLRRQGKAVFTVMRERSGIVEDASARKAKIEAATRVAEAWLKIYYAGEYARAWDEAAALIRRLTKEDAIRIFQTSAQLTGKPLTRSLVHQKYETSFFGLPDGEYVTIEYRTDFEHAKGLHELILVTWEPDGRWRVGTYGIQATGMTGPPADGWTRLFNGKDLTGWMPVYDTIKHRSPPWDVVGDVLQLKGDESNRGYLRTEKAFREFHLRFEYKPTAFAPLEPGLANSAIMWGVQGPDDTSKPPLAVRCHLAQDKTGREMASVYWRKELDPGIPWTNIRGGPTPADGWNRAEIISRDDSLEVRINGAGKVLNGYRPLTGPIGLLSDTQGLHLRHIEIKELGAGSKEKPRFDTDLILGTWRGVAAEVGAEQMPQAIIETVKPTLTFSADKVIAKPQGTFPKAFLEMAISKGALPKEASSIIEKGTEGIYHLDPTKSPKQIDFTILGEIKRTGLGIYQLDGDALKVCMSIDPAKVAERPKEFTSKAGEKYVVLTFRRLTPEEVILNDVERRIDPANGDGKGLPFALLERNGVAAVRFGKWLVVFEGVPSDAHGKILFGVGSFFIPETGGRGNFVDPGLKRPAPALRQQSDNRGNRIGIERYEFQLEAKGARLVFADKTYEATDKVQTIVIARDGTTRLEPAPKK